MVAMGCATMGLENDVVMKLKNKVVTKLENEVVRELEEDGVNGFEKDAAKRLEENPDEVLLRVAELVIAHERGTGLVQLVVEQGKANLSPHYH